MRYHLAWLIAIVALLCAAPAAGGPEALDDRIDAPDPDPTATAQAGPVASVSVRVETGEHAGAVEVIATSDGGRLLATGGTDRTVRLWRAEDLSPLRTWRPAVPVRGLLISEDGRYLAARNANEGGYDVLLGRDGEVALPERLRHQNLWRLSPDGSAALVLDHRCQIRQVPVDVGPEQLRFDASGERSYHWLSAATSSGEDLYAVSCSAAPPEDATDLHIVALGWKAKVSLHAPASALALSPDRRQLAVGTWGSDAVTVYSLDDLRAGVESAQGYLLGRGDAGALSRVASLAWSSDGSRLRALLSEGDGSGTIVDLDIAEASPRALTEGRITAVAWLTGDRAAYGTADGQLTVLDLRSARATASSKGASILSDLRGIALSDDGSALAITGTAEGTRTWSMRDLAWIRPLPSPPLPSPPFPSPNTTTDEGAPNPGDCLRWKGGAPQRDGREICLSTPDHVSTLGPQGAVYVGGPEGLTRYEATGAPRWSKPPPDAPVRMLAASADGRFLTAALGDGTFRWFDAEDGAAVVTLFTSADGRSWVAWTPSGYYTTSMGGDRLAGWEVLRQNAPSADFFALGGLRATFERPDVVRAAFQERGEARALVRLGVEAARAADLLPPVVEVMGGDGPLRVLARSDRPVLGWRVLADGRPLSGRDVKVEEAPAKTGSGAFSRILELRVPEGTKELSVFAISEAGTSEPVRVALEAPSTPTGRRDLYVLAVGVSDYARDDLDLHYARKDALDLLSALKGQDGAGMYHSVIVRAVSDGAATRQGVESGLAWISANAKRGDLAVIFLSGHGETVNRRSYFFGTHEVDPGDLEHTALPGATLIHTLAAVPATVILMLDTCKSSGVVSLTDLYNALSEPKTGVVVLTSSTADQVSLEDPSWGHGAFTRALLDGLAGGAALPGGGEISMNALADFVQREVSDLTSGAQDAQYAIPGAISYLPVAKVQAQRLDLCGGADQGLPLTTRLESLRCAVVQARAVFPELGVSLHLSPRSDGERSWCSRVDGLSCALQEPPEDEPWKDGERVRQRGDALVLRGPLRYDGDRLLDVDRLTEIRDWLDLHPLIGDLVLEGHGADASQARARAEDAWEALVRAGVHPRRLSVRVSPGAGELSFTVYPRGDEGLLARSVPLPWDGSAGPAALPPPPEAEACQDSGGDPPERLLERVSCGLRDLPADQIEGGALVPDDGGPLAAWCRTSRGLSCTLGASGGTGSAVLRQGSILIREPIEFASDQAVLRPSARPILDAVVRILREHAEIVQVEVEGHASSDGEALPNWRLSTERARAVVDALTASGISASRLSYRGLGEFVPLILGDSPAVRERNRRVEFHVVREGR